MSRELNYKLEREMHPANHAFLWFINYPRIVRYNMSLASFHQSLMGLQDEFRIFSSKSDGITR